LTEIQAIKPAWISVSKEHRLLLKGGNAVFVIKSAGNLNVRTLFL